MIVLLPFDVVPSRADVLEKIDNCAYSKTSVLAVNSTQKIVPQQSKGTEKYA